MMICIWKCPVALHAICLKSVGNFATCPFCHERRSGKDFVFSYVHFIHYKAKKLKKGENLFTARLKTVQKMLFSGRQVIHYISTDSCTSQYYILITPPHSPDIVHNTTGKYATQLTRTTLAEARNMLLPTQFTLCSARFGLQITFGDLRLFQNLKD